MVKKECGVPFLLLISLVASNQESTSNLSCTDWKGNSVPDGQPFSPSKDDLCKNCICENGYEVRCWSGGCSPPSCPMYEVVEGECCQFNCISPPHGSPTKSVPNDSSTTTPPTAAVNTSNLGLRLVAGFLTILLTLALVMFLVHRLRRRRLLTIRRRGEAEQLEEEDAGHYLPEFDQLDTGIDYPPYEEPPPPYTVTKTPFEAPPPYETLPRRVNDGDSSPSANISLPRSRAVMDSTGGGGGGGVTAHTTVNSVSTDSQNSYQAPPSGQRLDGNKPLEQYTTACGAASRPSCSYMHNATLPVPRSSPNTVKGKKDKRRRNSSPVQLLVEHEQMVNTSANSSPAPRNRNRVGIPGQRATKQLDTGHTTGARASKSNSKNQSTPEQNSAVETEVAFCAAKNTVSIRSKKDGCKQLELSADVPLREHNVIGGSTVVMKDSGDNVVVWSSSRQSGSPRLSYADNYSKDELEQLQRVGQYNKQVVNSTDNCESLDHPRSAATTEACCDVECAGIESTSGLSVARSDSLVSQLSAISINPETGEMAKRAQRDVTDVSEKKRADKEGHIPPAVSNTPCDDSSEKQIDTERDKKGHKSSYRFVETEPKYQCLRNETSPERCSRPRKRPNTVYKQYGFVDDPGVISAQDPDNINAVYTMEHDMNNPRRSRSHERMSHKSKERGASGDRSRSGSCHRTRSGSRDRAKQLRDRSRERALLHKQEKSERNTSRKNAQVSLDVGQVNGVVLKCRSDIDHVNAGVKRGESSKSKHRNSVPNSSMLGKKVATKGRSHRNKSKSHKQGEEPATNSKCDNIGVVSDSTSLSNVSKVRVKKHRYSFDITANGTVQSAYL